MSRALSPWQRPLPRRRFLGLTGLVAAGLGGGVLIGGCGNSAAGSGQTAELLSSEIELPPRFSVALPIPTELPPTSTADGRDLYEIVQRRADVEILPGRRTEIFGYEGTFPGPTIRSTRERETVVRHTNSLEVPTVVHLHGGHTPEESDGYPVDFVLPVGSDPDSANSGGGHGMHMGRDVSVGSRDYTYPMQQRAATLWYHDHRMDFTGPQVWRGLAGFHLVGDDEESELGLPAGARDIPLMICDRSFDGDAQMRYPAIDPSLMGEPGIEEEYMEGLLGDVVLVNGAPWPLLEVEAARYRFRLLNASNARRYDLVLEPGPDEGAPFVQIGSDGGLLAAPVEQDSITIAPAERFDVVVDFSAFPVGTRVTMRNTLGSGSTRDVLRFVVARNASDDSVIPDVLSEIEVIDPASAVRRRDWRFSRGTVGDHAGWTINDRAFDPDRMAAEVSLGEVEIWRFFTDLHHPVHVHLDPFQIVARGGNDPGRLDVGWKDTVDVRPAEFVDVAVRFSDYTGAFLMHCHNLEHEDMAMMAAFSTR